MRITRTRRTKIIRRRRNKILFNFFVTLPTVSTVMGYLITDLVILPNYLR